MKLLPFEKYPRVKTYWKLIFHRGFRLVDSEVKVFADFGISKRGNNAAFGSIDHIAEYKGGRWLIEEDFAGGDKWHWSKIVAYRAAYLLDNPSATERSLNVAVFLNMTDYSYRLQNILACMGIRYFFFEISSGLKIIKTSNPEVIRGQHLVYTPNLSRSIASQLRSRRSEDLKGKKENEPQIESQTP